MKITPRKEFVLGGVTGATHTGKNTAAHLTEACNLRKTNS